MGSVGPCPSYSSVNEPFEMTGNSNQWSWVITWCWFVQYVVLLFFFQLASGNGNVVKCWLVFLTLKVATRKTIFDSSTTTSVVRYGMHSYDREVINPWHSYWEYSVAYLIFVWSCLVKWYKAQFCPHVGYVKRANGIQFCPVCVLVVKYSARYCAWYFAVHFRIVPSHVYILHHFVLH